MTENGDISPNPPRAITVAYRAREPLARMVRVAPVESDAGSVLDSKVIMPYVCCMSTLKVTSKGQVTFRKEVLEHLGVSPGEQIEVELLPQGRVAVKAAAKKKIQDLFGVMHDPKRAPVSIEDMNKAIAAGWAGKRK